MKTLVVAEISGVQWIIYELFTLRKSVATLTNTNKRSAKRAKPVFAD
jgi:hypothetical protein